MDAAGWNERYAGSDLVWSVTPNRFVAQELADLAPTPEQRPGGGSAVDLAAGEGRNALWLAEQGWRVTAVDFAEAGLAKGRRLEAERAGRIPAGAPFTPSVAWVVDDALTWSPPGPVDLVVVAYLQLVPAQRRRAVANAVRMLAPGGTLLLVAHDSTNLTEGTGGPQDPDVLFTARDVLDDLAAEGLDVDVDVERAERVERPVAGETGHGEDGPDSDSTSRVAYDVLVRLRKR